MFLSLADLPVRDALPGCGYEWRPPGWSAMKNRPAVSPPTAITALP